MQCARSNLLRLQLRRIESHYNPSILVGLDFRVFAWIIAYPIIFRQIVIKETYCKATIFIINQDWPPWAERTTDNKQTCQIRPVIKSGFCVPYPGNSGDRDEGYDSHYFTDTAEHHRWAEFRY